MRVLAKISGSASNWTSPQREFLYQWGIIRGRCGGDRSEVFAAGLCQSCAGGSGGKRMCACSVAVMCSDGVGSVKFRGHDMSSDFRETTEYHADRYYRCRRCSVLLAQA